VRRVARVGDRGTGGVRVTYAEMRALFARLSGDGRQCAVILATGEPRAGRAGVVVAWTVVVRDDARPPLPGTDVRALYRLTDPTDLARLEEGRAADGLCGVEEEDSGGRLDPAHRLTWHEVLRALDQVDTYMPGWTVERIMGTPVRQPRYCLVLRSADGVAHPVPSYDVLDGLCLDAGPLGVGGPAIGRVTALTGRGDGRAAGSQGNAVTVWALQPGHRPLPWTRGGLPLAVAADGACVWVDLCAPGADDVRVVARALGLPYRATLATLSPDGQSRFVSYRDYAALRVAVARREPPAGGVAADALDLIVGRHVLVTIHARPLPALQRARLRDMTSGDDAAPTLASVVLAELLTSEEALARWVAREADGRVAGAPKAEEPRTQVAGAVRTRQATAALRRLSERRSYALAVARAEAEAWRASSAPPLPSLDYLLAREARLVAALRATEGRADGAVRLLVARATWRARARHAGLMRLAYALGATAVVGLARLALSGMRPHLAGLALGATTLVGFIIAGMGGALAARAGGASGGRAERRARAAWGDEDEDEEGEIG